MHWLELIKSDVCFRLPGNEIVKCSSYIIESMKITGCDITSEDLKSRAFDVFYMVIGTYNGTSVKNTCKINGPNQNGMWMFFSWFPYSLYGHFYILKSV